MPSKKKFRSGAFESIHASAVALRKVGAIDDERMREFDAACFIEPVSISPADIRALRSLANVSAADFARRLNTNTSTVLNWECGKSRPRGISLRLLAVVRRHGISILD